MSYFATDEFRRFYAIARNHSTQSINIDKTSVFFFGALNGSGIDAQFYRYGKEIW